MFCLVLMGFILTCVVDLSILHEMISFWHVSIIVVHKPIYNRCLVKQVTLKKFSLLFLHGIGKRAST